MNIITAIAGVLAALMLAVLAAWLGRQYGRRLRTGVAFVGAFLFGFGAVIDPPVKHVAESTEAETETDDNGEPK